MEFPSEFCIESNSEATKQTLDKGQQFVFQKKNTKMKKLVTALLINLAQKHENKSIKILIIGGGIMGLGSAWYLSQR